MTKFSLLSLDAGLVLATGLGFVAVGALGFVMNPKGSGFIGPVVFVAIAVWLFRLAFLEMKRKTREGEGQQPTQLPFVPRATAWLFVLAVTSTIVFFLIWAFTASAWSFLAVLVSAQLLVLFAIVTIIAAAGQALWFRINRKGQKEKNA
jgi:small-conductance mechanosensitive channel